MASASAHSAILFPPNLSYPSHPSACLAPALPSLQCHSHYSFLPFSYSTTYYASSISTSGLSTAFHSHLIPHLHSISIFCSVCLAHGFRVWYAGAALFRLPAYYPPPTYIMFSLPYYLRFADSFCLIFSGFADISSTFLCRCPFLPAWPTYRAYHLLRLTSVRSTRSTLF